MIWNREFRCSLISLFPFCLVFIVRLDLASARRRAKDTYKCTSIVGRTLIKQLWHKIALPRGRNRPTASTHHFVVLPKENCNAFVCFVVVECIHRTLLLLLMLSENARAIKNVQNQYNLIAPSFSLHEFLKIREKKTSFSFRLQCKCEWDERDAIDAQANLWCCTRLHSNQLFARKLLFFFLVFLFLLLACFAVHRIFDWTDDGVERHTQAVKGFRIMRNECARTKGVANVCTKRPKNSILRLVFLYSFPLNGDECVLFFHRRSTKQRKHFFFFFLSLFSLLVWPFLPFVSFWFDRKTTSLVFFTPQTYSLVFSLGVSSISQSQRVEKIY